MRSAERPTPERIVADTSQAIELLINGQPARLITDPTKPLLSVLRNELGLRGSRFGCGLEQCGACMVLIDGEATPSCARSVETVVNRSVTTVEGLAEDREFQALREAFLSEQAGQCGYCLAGILVSAVALLKSNPAPTRDQICEALERNLCRCGAHNRIIRAVQRAAVTRRNLLSA
jgi:nicotinate dehydrogenase subunit A